MSDQQSVRDLVDEAIGRSRRTADKLDGAMLYLLFPTCELCGAIYAEVKRDAHVDWHEALFNMGITHGIDLPSATDELWRGSP